MPLIEPLQRLVLEDSLKTLKKMAEVTASLQKIADDVQKETDRPLDFYEEWAANQEDLAEHMMEADEDVAKAVVDNFPAIMNDAVEEALAYREENAAEVLDKTEQLVTKVGEFHKENSK